MLVDGGPCGQCGHEHAGATGRDPRRGAIREVDVGAPPLPCPAVSAVPSPSPARASNPSGSAVGEVSASAQPVSARVAASNTSVAATRNGRDVTVTTDRLRAGPAGRGRGRHRPAQCATTTPAISAPRRPSSRSRAPVGGEPDGHLDRPPPCAGSCERIGPVPEPRGTAPDRPGSRPGCAGPSTRGRRGGQQGSRSAARRRHRPAAPGATDCPSRRRPR